MGAMQVISAALWLRIKLTKCSRSREQGAGTGAAAEAVGSGAGAGAGAGTGALVNNMPMISCSGAVLPLLIIAEQSNHRAGENVKGRQCPSALSSHTRIR